MNGKLLENKIVIVTGGSRGIGKAIAQRCACLGADTIIIARNIDEIEKTVAECKNKGIKLSWYVADVTNELEVTKTFELIKAQKNTIDVLINNVGGGIYGPFCEFSSDDFEKVIKVNVKSTFLCSREAIKIMLSRKSGYIINISSVVGFKGYPNQSAYSAAKHAVMGLTKSLAREVYKEGIRVSAILPGGVNTEMIRKARPDLKPEELLEPDDVAHAVEYLLSLSPRAAVDEIYIRRRYSEPF